MKVLKEVKVTSRSKKALVHKGTSGISKHYTLFNTGNQKVLISDNNVNFYPITPGSEREIVLHKSETLYVKSNGKSSLSIMEV